MIKFRCLLFLMVLNIIAESCIRNAFCNNFYNIKKSTRSSESLHRFNGENKLSVNLFRRIAKALANNKTSRKMQYETLRVPDDMSMTCKGGCVTVESCSSTQRTSKMDESTSESSSLKQSSLSEKSSPSSRRPRLTRKPNATRKPNVTRKPNATRKSCSSRQPCKKLPRSVNTGRHRRFTAATTPKSLQQCNSPTATSQHHTISTNNKYHHIIATNERECSSITVNRHRPNKICR